MLACVNYGLIERSADNSETVLTVSYNALVPPYVSHTLDFAGDDGETREMQVLEIVERPEVKDGVLFVIVQSV